jgi:hypothetical protein
MNRQSGLAIDTMPGLDHIVLNIASYSMLWAKERTQVDIRMLM